MSEVPYVSVIVPVRNAEATIAVCIRSLLSLRYPPERYEVIVVDDGSVDRTPDILARQNVRIIAESHRGAYGARNTGARSARGDIFAFTDADCTADQQWLSRLVTGFSDRTVGCVAGEVASPQSATPVEEFARRRNLMTQLNTLRHPYLPYPITANCAYRAETFRRLQGFREDMPSGGDADLAWRMQKDLGLKIAFIPGAVVMHYHRSSLGELIRQSSKYARGAMDLTRWHGLARPPLARRVAGVAASAMRALKDVPLRMARNGRRDPAAWMEPVCDLAWRVGEVAGMLGWYRSQMGGRIRP